MTRILRAATIALVSLSIIAPAVARPKKDDAPPDPGTAAATTKALEPEVPNCTRSYGTVAINEPDNQWWRALQLGSPSSLIRVIVTRSHCFKVVNRGVGLGMRNQERGLGDELQRGSNVGAGQVKSADFFLVPDLIGANSNAGGQGVGAGIGSLFGGGIVGGILGGIRSKKSTARTVLTLVNARTTEEVYSAEGQVRRSNVSFGLGGLGGGGGIGGAAVGGGYGDTEIGRIISAAHVAAYADLVRQVQGGSGGQEAAAPRKALHVVRATAMLNRPGGKVMKFLKAGDVVYPTGERAGILVKVAD